MPLYIAAILVMIVVDQAVKHWAFTVLQPQHTIPLIENVFHLTYIENRGAAFSMFAKFDSRWIFVALAAVITLAICYALSKKLMQTALGSWSLVLIAAGAVGNAVDRVARGFVVDMFDFRLIHFPVFNVADIFICVGGVLFVIYFMFQHKDKPNDKNEAVNDNE
nr:signal peptidase II [uncultured Agathobaculum sp.]